MNLRTLLSEPSTWRGLIWIFTAAGISLNPEQQAALIAFGMAAAGLIGVVFLDQPKAPSHPSLMHQAESRPPDVSTIPGHNDR